MQYFASAEPPGFYLSADEDIGRDIKKIEDKERHCSAMRAAHEESMPR